MQYRGCEPEINHYLCDMIKVGEILVSDDIKDVEFVCHLEKCKGACCVEGDLGAPLEDDELEVIKEIQEKIKPYLTPDGLKQIEKVGPYVLDEDGDHSTPVIEGRECAYAHYDKQGILNAVLSKLTLTGNFLPKADLLSSVSYTDYEDQKTGSCNYMNGASALTRAVLENH